MVKPLPVEAQFSPIYGILLDDFDQDGALDILAAGNFDYSKPEVGSYDASYGVFLKGDKTRDFKFIKPVQSGFHIDGQVRDIASILIKSKRAVMISKNNDYAEIFGY